MSTPERPPTPLEPLGADDEMSLAELVNRVLDRGAVISGDVTISVAGVDLIHLELRLLISAVESLRRRSGER